MIGNADGETRTLTPWAPEPKSGASTNSATSAHEARILTIALPPIQHFRDGWARADVPAVCRAASAGPRWLWVR